jgi:hypothetical protein
MMSYNPARVAAGPEEGEMKEIKKAPYRKVRAWIKTLSSTYTGTIFLSKDQTRISDVMNDERQFISLIDVESKDFASPKAYLAINKDLIELVEILEPEMEKEP